jgi:hypothetical protein
MIDVVLRILEVAGISSSSTGGGVISIFHHLFF